MGGVGEGDTSPGTDQPSSHMPPAEEMPAGHWEHFMDTSQRGGPVPAGHQEAPPGVIPAAHLNQHLIPGRTCQLPSPRSALRRF